MEFLNIKELVSKVQKALGLKEDGIDGPTTWKAIATKIIGETENIIERANFSS